MKLEVGDQVTMLNLRTKKPDDVKYVIVEIFDTSIKVKHPDIGGHFTFAIKNIAHVHAQKQNST
tara:strand:- start:732 stop:923 length:192 start_codon:yes stop_codon:yes gene_type:complete